MKFIFIESTVYSAKYTVMISEQPEIIDQLPIETLTQIRYRLTEAPGTEFEIQATKEGVRVVGGTPILTSQEDLDELQQVLQWALRQYQSLKDTGRILDQEVLSRELSA